MPRAGLINILKGGVETVGSPANARVPEHESRLTVVPRKHYGRKAAGGIALLVSFAIALTLLRNDNIKWAVIGEYLFNKSILSGVGLTVVLTIIAMVIGVVGGIILAIMTLSDSLVFKGLADFYLWVFRGTPQLIQLIFWYNLAFLFPVIGLGSFALDTNKVVTPFIAAVVGLSLNETAYMAEIIRGGILGVPKGQSEAALAAGMTPSTTMRKVILPQTMKMIIPPTGNQAIAMLKVTSLVSVISAKDLLTNAQIIYARNYYVIELLIVAAIWYLVLTSIATLIQGRIERVYDLSSKADKSGRSVLRRTLARRVPA